MRAGMGWWSIAGGVLVVVSGLGLCFAPTPLRDPLYREISYQVVANRATKGAVTDRERMLRLFELVHLQLNVVARPTIDETVWNDLVRGIGWCDQQSWALATLLSKKGIHARFAMLRDAKGISPHTVGEVLLDGRWIVVDPLNGLIFRYRDGSFATLEELSQDPTLLSEHPRVQLMEPVARADFIAGMERIYPMPMDSERWSSLLVLKNNSRAKRMINGVLAWSVRHLGAPFTHSYQDIYLLTERLGAGDAAERLFLRGRSYHLYGRIRRAERAYGLLIEQYPQHPRREDAQFYRGVLRHEAGQFLASMEDLSDLTTRIPDTVWWRIAQYYMGRNYEATDRIADARAAYEQLTDSLDTDAQWRLARLAASQ